jgi:tetratricopeptide (TPR) repeat protein
MNRSTGLATALAVAATLSTIPCAWARAERSSSLTSPFLVERESAERLGFGDGARGREAAGAALREPGDYRLRAEAATVLGRSGDADAIPMLVRALGSEKSPSVQRAIGRALALLGGPAIEAVKAAHEHGDLDSDALAAFAREKVLLSLERFALTVTGSDGEVKGFFAEPFRELKQLEGLATEPLLEVVFGSSYSLLAKTLAVRALGDIGATDSVARLRSAWDELDSPFVTSLLEMRFLNAPLASTVDPIDELRKAIAFALERLGESKPFEDLVDDYQRQIARRLEDVSLFERTHGKIWDDPEQLSNPVVQKKLSELNQAEWELAYAYNQVRRFDEAIAQYGKVVDNLERMNRAREISKSLLNLTHYNLACIHSQRNDVEASLHELTLAIETGFRDFAWIDKDRDLDAVRGDPRFAKILSKGK